MRSGLFEQRFAARMATAILLILLSLSLAHGEGATVAEVKPTASAATLQQVSPLASDTQQAQLPAAQIQAQGILAEGNSPGPGSIKITPGFVSNIFADEDIRAALRDIGAQSGTIIIPDQTVQGIVSVELRNVPIEQALDMVLFGGGYVFKKIGDYYLVGSPDPKNPSFSTLASIERVSLRQSNAKEVYDALNPVYYSYVQADPTNNVLVVTAPERLLRQIVDQIKTIDQPAEQVMIEIMVVEVASGKAKDLGIRWRFDSFGFDVGDPLLSNSGSGASAVSGLTNTLSWTEVAVQDLVNLRLLVTKDLASIRANPRISTLNGREATLFVGRQEFFSVITGNSYYPTTQLQEVNAGITLKIKPFIGEKGDLVIYLDPEVSDVIGTSANGSPIVAKRTVHTVVRSQEEKTIVIGGLTQVIKQMRKTKVPILGDIPLIGQLFRHSEEANEETEVVIFLRPHILRNGSASTWQPDRNWPEVLTPSQETASQAAAAKAEAAAAAAAKRARPPRAH